MRPRRRDGGRERGAVAVFVAVASLVMLTSAAFAVDLGMQRVARSDLQALADVVALDLSRDLDGVNSPQYFDTKWATAGSTMQQSLQRNPIGIGQSPGTSAPWICSSRACITAVAGYVDGTGVFHAYATTDSSAGDSPTAVQVSAQATVPFGFSRVVGVSSGNAHRSSVAIAVPQSATTPTPLSSSSGACVAVGSYLLRASTGSSPLLNGLLGNSLGVTAVGYQGVATTRVNVGSLMANATLGTASQPLSSTVTLGTLLTAMANASTSAGAVAINNFRALVPIGKLNASIGAVGTFLNVNNSGALANATVTAGDLLGAAVSIANGKNFISTGVNISLGGVSLSASVAVIQPPQIGCFPNSAKTGQVEVRLTGSQLLLGTVTISLGLAQATATPTTLTCNGWTPTALGVALSGQSVATAEVDASLLNLISLSELGLGSSLNIGSNAPSTQSLALPTYYDPSFYPATPTATTLVPSASGLLSLLQLNALNPVIADLDSMLSSTTNALGVNLAGADLAAEPTPSCVTPSLGG